MALFDWPLLRDPNYLSAADSCKTAGGGWSKCLRFWWHLAYEEEVVRRARLPNNKHGKLISINVLEFVCVIINFAAAIYAIHVDGGSTDMYPVLCNWCDNTAACSWVNYKCKQSLIGRRLALLFVGLLLSTNLGIQAEWISTLDNFIADDISRFKNEKSHESTFDYSSLLSSYPNQLQGCRQFIPSNRLLSLISDVLLKGVSPDPLTIKEWTPEMLGHFGS